MLLNIVAEYYVAIYIYAQYLKTHASDMSKLVQKEKHVTQSVSSVSVARNKCSSYRDIAYCISTVQLAQKNGITHTSKVKVSFLHQVVLYSPHNT